MSYCVNCGVELEEAAKKCPLCSTPVINPNILSIPETHTSYADKPVDIPKSTKKRFTAFIVTMVMLIPNIVCFLVNILFNYDYTWVWLLNATSLLVWTFVVLPLLCEKKPLIFYIITDTAVSLGYAYIINYLRGFSGWYFQCAVPCIIVFACVFGGFIEFTSRKKQHWISVCISLFLCIIMVSIPLDIVITHFIKGSFIPSVSLIISACCLAVIFFFITVRRNKKMQAWLDRKFFVD